MKVETGVPTRGCLLEPTAEGRYVMRLVQGAELARLHLAANPPAPSDPAEPRVARQPQTFMRDPSGRFFDGLWIAKEPFLATVRREILVLAKVLE